MTDEQLVCLMAAIIIAPLKHYSPDSMEQCIDTALSLQNEIKVFFKDDEVKSSSS
jgi:hypothetical protein